MSNQNGVLKFLIIPAGESNGTENELSKRSILLLEKAIEIYNNKKVDFLIVAGGVFETSNKNNVKPVAFLMKNWLLEFGKMDKSIVLVEDKSFDLNEGITNSIKTIKSVICIKNCKNHNGSKFGSEIIVVGDSKCSKEIKGFFAKENLSIFYENSNFR